MDLSFRWENYSLSPHIGYAIENDNCSHHPLPCSVASSVFGLYCARRLMFLLQVRLTTGERPNPAKANVAVLCKLWRVPRQNCVRSRAHAQTSTPCLPLARLLVFPASASGPAESDTAPAARRAKKLRTPYCDLFGRREAAGATRWFFSPKTTTLLTERRME